MEDFEKKLVMGTIAILIIILIVALMARAEPVNISCNDTYMFSFTDALNISQNQSFYCSPENCVQNITIVNVTTVINCTEINRTIFNFTLLPGEFTHQNTSMCELHAFCNDTNSTYNQSASCILSRNLAFGETYDYEVGSCDVHMSCPDKNNDSDDELCVAHEDIAYNKSFRTYSKDGRLCVSLDGDEQCFIANSTFDYSTMFQYTCPADLRINVSSVSEEMMSLCSKVNPYLMTWVDKGINRGFDCQDQLIACATQKASVELNCDDQVRGEKEGRLMAEVAANGTLISYQKCLDDKSEIQGSMGFWQALVWIQAGLGGMLIVACVILSVALWKSRHDNTPGLKGTGGDF